MVRIQNEKRRLAEQVLAMQKLKQQQQGVAQGGTAGTAQGQIKQQAGAGAAGQQQQQQQGGQGGSVQGAAGQQQQPQQQGVQEEGKAKAAVPWTGAQGKVRG